MSIIISLTSHGRRIHETAHIAVASLLNQSVQADKVVLWLDEPPSVALLAMDGLEIRQCESIRSYKKLIPALREFPNDVIVTADDDLHYPNDWLECIVEEHRCDPDCIVGHYIADFTKEGMLNFNSWSYKFDKYVPYDAIEEAAFPRPASGCGMLVPSAEVFYQDYNREDLFMNLAPTDDELWWWAMAFLKKTKYRKTKRNWMPWDHYIVTGDNAGGSSLWSYNQTGPYIAQRKAVLEYYPTLREQIESIVYY